MFWESRGEGGQGKFSSQTFKYCKKQDGSMDPQKSLLEKFWAERFLFTAQEIDAFRKVKREDFVPLAVRLVAYEDTPLPILRGKTISQPTTVMLMTHALEIMPGNKIFEVGTGSGFQTAVLS